jgi:hypothetical protein
VNPTPYYYTVERFTSSRQESLTVMIDWGDGTAPTLGWVGGAAPYYDAYGKHSYAEDGLYTVTTTIIGSSGDGAAVQSPCDVVLGPMQADSVPAFNVVNPGFTWTQPLSPVITQTQGQTNAEGDYAPLQVNATDPNGYALSYDATSLPAGLTINHTNGLISGNVSYSAAEAFGGLYPVTVVVADAGGASASENFNWNITDVVRPPTFTAAILDQTNVDGGDVLLQVGATQPENDQIIFGASDLPDGLSIDSTSGLISGTLADDAATSVVTVTATDQGETASESFNWNISVNHAPTLTVPSDQTNAASDPVNLALSGTDAPGNTLTYTVTGLPGGLSIADPSSGVISGTLQNDAASNTPYLVTATVSDGTASVSATFHWTVNFVGVSNPSDQYNTAGDTVSLPITAADASGIPTYSATGLPQGLSIDPGSGVISGTIAPTAGSDNPYAVTVTATDGVNSNNTSFNWYVAVPVLTDRTDVEGTPVLFQAPAPTDTSPSYGATNLPNGISINSGTGQISGTLATGDAANGPYPVVVTTTYGDGSSSSQGFNWTVIAVVTTPPALTNPGPQTSIAGTAVNVDLSTTAPNGDPLTYSADGLPDGLYLDPDTGIVSGTPAEDAIQSSAYPVAETVTDSFGNSASQTFNWTITDSTLIVQGNTLSATEGAGAIFSVATFFDPDLNRQATDYTATISWGDGQTSQGWVDAVDGVAGSYTVSGDHAYLHPGSLPVQVTVTDPAYGSTTVVETASVASVPLTANGGFQEGAVNNLASTLTVAVFSDPNTYDTEYTYVATINWGDGTTATAGVVDGADGQFRVTGNHEYTADGIYTVGVTITDDDGTQTTTTSTVTVGDLYANVAENVTAGWFTANSLLGSPSSYTATIAWGDGATDSTLTAPTTVKLTGSEGSFAVSGTHTYAATGTYTVKITVVDAAGTKTVAYDTVQAVTAPATGYDGEVATTVGTASDATEAVAVDPGGQNDNNGDQQDVPETQAPASPGEYDYLIPILSAAGALVTVAEAKVDAPLTAKEAGPAVVPGNSIYEYEITFSAPVDKGNINPGWNFFYDGGKVGASNAHPNRNAAGQWTGFILTVSFPNTPEVVTLSIEDLLKGDKPGTTIISFKVDVVQVKVEDVANNFAPSNSIKDKSLNPFLATVDGTKGQTVYDVPISTKGATSPGLQWQAQVTLIAPKGTNDQTHIMVGFHQTLTYDKLRGWAGKNFLKASVEGDTYLDGNPKAGVRPWIDLDPSSFTPKVPAVIKGVAGPTIIGYSDSPTLAPIILYPNGKFLADRVEASWGFDLSVAAATDDKVVVGDYGSADSHLFREAYAHWSVNADGTFKAGLLGGNIVSQWTPGAKAGLVPPTGRVWDLNITSPKDLLTTGDLANEAADVPKLTFSSK